MTLMIYLLVALAILYGVIKLFERGAFKVWDLWRNRKRPDEIIVIRPDPEDLPHRARPKLRRERKAEPPAPPDESSDGP